MHVNDVVETEQNVTL